MNMESIYEYGSKRGFWRIHELFKKKKIPLTIFGVAMALERNKEVCNAMKKAGYEIASHEKQFHNPLFSLHYKLLYFSLMPLQHQILLKEFFSF